jgi:hypothetical protein
MKYEVINLKEFLNVSCNRDGNNCNPCQLLSKIPGGDVMTIIDLSGIELICSSMFANFILKKDNVILCDVKNRVRQVMDILKVGSVIPVFKDLESAIHHAESL